MLKRLFPTLAEWPAEKWLGVPIAILILFGCIMGLSDLIFGARVMD